MPHFFPGSAAVNKLLLAPGMQHDKGCSVSGHDFSHAAGAGNEGALAPGFTQLLTAGAKARILSSANGTTEVVP
jgi:hypothetical protein